MVDRPGKELDKVWSHASRWTLPSIVPGMICVYRKLDRRLAAFAASSAAKYSLSWALASLEYPADELRFEVVEDNDVLDDEGVSGRSSICSDCWCAVGHMKYEDRGRDPVAGAL